MSRLVVEELSSAVKCSLKLMGNVFAWLTKDRRLKSFIFMMPKVACPLGTALLKGYIIVLRVLSVS